jgi:branched-chain amino acid transport system permease protein
VDAPVVAPLTGGAPARISMMGWAIGSMLAALAGILLAPLVTLDILGLTLLVINGYAAAMVGRLRSLPLTFGGGIALGLIETYATGYLPAGDILSQLHTTLPIVFLFAALLIFPERRLRVGRSVNRRPCASRSWAPARSSPWPGSRPACSPTRTSTRSTPAWSWP